MKMNSADAIELTIKNIFEIIPVLNITPFETLTENEQVAIRMALLNMQERAYNKGWYDCVDFVQSV